jgi:hypothetical protein
LKKEEIKKNRNEVNQIMHNVSSSLCNGSIEIKYYQRTSTSTTTVILGTEWEFEEAATQYFCTEKTMNNFYN